MQFVQPQELIFLHDAFGFTIDPQYGDKYLFLPETYELVKGCTSILLSQDDNILDSAIFERLRIKQTNPLVYLIQSKNQIENICEKPWFNFPEVQKVIQFCRGLIHNYSEIALNQPDDIFTERSKSDRELKFNNDIHLQAISRIFDVFDITGFDADFFHNSILSLQNTYQINLYEKVLLYVCKCTQQVSFYFKQFHIYQEQPYFYMQIIHFYLKDQKLKQLLFTQSLIPWIPSRNGGLLKEGIEPCSGTILEFNSILGYFLNISLLQNNEYLLNRAHLEIGTKNTKKSFQIKLRNYMKTSKEYTMALTNLFKECLKKSGTQIDSFAETFRFLRVAIHSNKSKIQEGTHLKKNKKSFEMSSDGFMLNIYDVLLELSRKIFNRVDETYLKIDVRFLLGSPFNNEQMLLSKVKQKQPIEVGNVSNLFFYTLKFAQYGLLSVIENYKQLTKEIEDVEKQLNIFSNDKSSQISQVLKRLKDQSEQLRKEEHQFESVLFDSQRIKDSVDLFDTYMMLMIQWMEVPKMVDGQSLWNTPEIYYYLPEYILLNIFELHLFYVQYKEDYLQIDISVEKASRLFEMTTYLLNLKMADNVYIGAQFVELIYFMTRVDKWGVMRRCFLECKVGMNNVVIGLIKLYSKVGESGENNQFYTKFSYRLYINELMIELFRIDNYVEQMRIYQQIEETHRMIKMMIDDINYSFEEVWNKVELILTLEAKPLGPNFSIFQKEHEKQFNLQQSKSNLSHCQSTLKFLVVLSELIPQLLANDLFIDQLTANLNSYMNTFFKKEKMAAIQYLKQNAEKLFKPNQFLFQIAQIYVNLSHIDCVKESVLKDQRYFQFEYFSLLLKNYTQQPAATQMGSEKLYNFVNQLQDLSTQNFDIEDLIEVPDKYLDPLFSTLIRDPVQLPISNQIVDRKIIKQHLLSSQTDPFTKEPLKENDLIEMPQFKQEIENWLKMNDELIKLNKKKMFEKKAKDYLEQMKDKIQTEENNEDNNEGQNVFQGRKYNDDD